MALDCWLLHQHAPALRFYTWSPPAVSLGYHQQRWPEHWQHLSWQGHPVDLVRRPTGGRAVLHQGDLTYAIALCGLPPNRMQTYQKICEFLIQGWRSLGVELHYGTAQRGYQQQTNCFALATGADLVLADGTKFIGSAQVWRQGTVLQHGSIRLAPDPALFTQVFGTELELPQDLPAAASVSTIITALSEAACQCFEVDLQVQPLTSVEWQAVETYSGCTSVTGG